jgi:hypothetical protein
MASSGRIARQQDGRTFPYKRIRTYSFSVTGNGRYRLIVTCINSNQTTTTNAVTVSAASPTYATIPYLQDFETWGNYCAVNDVPTGNNWTNQPASGAFSWRRNDQGASAGWTNPTLGTYSPASRSGLYSARFHTYSATYTPYFGDLDLYLNASTVTGNKQLYFWFRNNFSVQDGDSLVVMLSTNGGSSFTQIGGVDTANAWKRVTMPIASNAANTIIRFRGKKNVNYDYSDMGLDSVYIAPPCTGTPVAGTISPAGGTGCPGTQYSLNLNGVSMAGNLQYQWEDSTGPAGWLPVANNNNGPSYTTPALSDTVRYRVRVTCLGSGLFAISPSVLFNVAEIPYAAIPYTEDFESWSSRCGTNDIPSASWTNLPFTGNASWRRQDQGTTAAWTSPTIGQWWPATPIAASGSHAARFHSYYATPNGTIGRLDLHVNCSTVPGTKELQFYVNKNNASQFQLDTLRVFYSTDGGATFTFLTGIQSTMGWELKTFPIPSNSAQTVIRFSGKSYNYYTDMGLDLVKILPPCAAVPNAGTINPVTTCPNQTFSLSLVGNTQAAGLTYQWQQSTTANGTYTNIPAVQGGTQPIYSTSISAPMWYRAIVTCTNGGLSDTTPAFQVVFSSFFSCYCGSNALYTSLGNVGNVKLERLNNNNVATSTILEQWQRDAAAQQPQRAEYLHQLHERDAGYAVPR